MSAPQPVRSSRRERRPTEKAQYRDEPEAEAVEHSRGHARKTLAPAENTTPHKATDADPSFTTRSLPHENVRKTPNPNLQLRTSTVPPSLSLVTEGEELVWL
ncbi:hypothetical protein PLICRDRAFT_180319 [Plicaturopsis crispa FD-325 SS-3]|uniref:Uncharacterized protein n=1 Tax=Plicaturopsis crispa FD-325 SS-3 TaxID=944288 RepID=A0A0C9SW86_PLICR|nr:hypothetical protein PLICRDRAFT_180319 [Plicaturopsis crispa FD-325 SS-3]